MGEPQPRNLLQEELDSLTREEERIRRHRHLTDEQKRNALFHVMHRQIAVKAALAHAQRQSDRLPEDPEP